MAAESTENGTTTAPTTTTIAAPTTTALESETVPSETTVKMETDAPVTEPTQVSEDAQATNAADKRWPGWPGNTVFRLIVPVSKVGGIIGKKGELIKKLCEDTKARVRILDGPITTQDRIVLISGKEEPDAPISPAMNAVLRVFKRITGLTETEGEGVASSAAAVAPCSIKLLVATSQAINLIGKQGSQIKTIQETSAASVRVLQDNLPSYVTPDEKIIDIQGETLKVYRALEAVIGHLRKFLVDQSVVPLFEKTGTEPAPPQDVPTDSWADKTPSFPTATKTGVAGDYLSTYKRDSSFLDRDTQLDSQHSGVSRYGTDPALAGFRPSGLTRVAPIVTQMTQTMQIPLSYAEDIIGIAGVNIGYIRRTSGAILTVQESRGSPEEIVVEIKGTSTQVQSAQQLIQDFMAGHHKEPLASNYSRLDSGLRSSYSHSGNTSYPSSSLGTQSYGGYGSSGVGGYSNFRL